MRLADTSEWECFYPRKISQTDYKHRRVWPTPNSHIVFFNLTITSNSLKPNSVFYKLEAAINGETLLTDATI